MHGFDEIERGVIAATPDTVFVSRFLLRDTGDLYLRYIPPVPPKSIMLPIPRRNAESTNFLRTVSTFLI